MKPVINSVTATQPTNAKSKDGKIIMTGLTAGTAYTIGFKKNDKAVFVTNTANANGDLTLSELAPATYSDFVVTDTTNPNAEENSWGPYAGEPIVIGATAPTATDDKKEVVAPGQNAGNTTEPNPLQKADGPGLQNKQKIQEVLNQYFANTHGGEPAQDVKDAGAKLISELSADDSGTGAGTEKSEIIKLLSPDIHAHYMPIIAEMVYATQDSFLTRMEQASTQSENKE